MCGFEWGELLKGNKSVKGVQLRLFIFSLLPAHHDWRLSRANSVTFCTGTTLTACHTLGSCSLPACTCPDMFRTQLGGHKRCLKRRSEGLEGAYRFLGSDLSKTTFYILDERNQQQHTKKRQQSNWSCFNHQEDQRSSGLMSQIWVISCAKVVKPWSHLKHQGCSFFAMLSGSSS